MEYQGPKIRSFKDLDAWKEGHRLVLEVYRLTKKFPKDELFALVSQMRRAAVSITSNIAEGFGRHSFREKVQFFYIARGSTIELENQFLGARDVGYISPVESGSIDAPLLKVNKILNGLISSTKRRDKEV